MSDIEGKQTGGRMTRLITIWHMHLGQQGDPKAMSTFEIPARPLWFWEMSRPYPTKAAPSGGIDD